MKIEDMRDPAAPQKLISMRTPEALWEEVQRTARDESKRLGRHVPASEIMRDGAFREMRRLRRRLDRK